MTFLDKFKFWKKEEDKFAELDKQLGTVPVAAHGEDINPHHPFGGETFGQPVEETLLQSSESGLDFGKQEAGFQPFGMNHPGEKKTMYQQGQVYEVQPQSTQPQNVQQQLELIAAKLDTIRVSLESINHRLVAVEHVLHVPEYEEVPPRRRRGAW